MLMAQTTKEYEPIVERMSAMLRETNELLRSALPDPMTRTQLNAVRLHLQAALGI